MRFPPRSREDAVLRSDRGLLGRHVPHLLRELHRHPRLAIRANLIQDPLFFRQKLMYELFRYPRLGRKGTGGVARRIAIEGFPLGEERSPGSVCIDAVLPLARRRINRAQLRR